MNVRLRDRVFLFSSGFISLDQMFQAGQIYPDTTWHGVWGSWPWYMSLLFSIFMACAFTMFTIDTYTRPAPRGVLTIDNQDGDITAHVTVTDMNGERSFSVLPDEDGVFRVPDLRDMSQGEDN